VKGVHNVITLAKFGDDSLRGSGVVAGQISAFSIDFAGRPYNTLTLPCERVIIKVQFLYINVCSFSTVFIHMLALVQDFVKIKCEHHLDRKVKI